MRKFNEEDYNSVKSYEKDFERAIKSRYCTGLSKEELEVVLNIYSQCLNRQANLSCGGCVLQMMTSVGRLYFAFKEPYEARIREEARKKEIEAQESQIKKKRVRRKKNEKETEEKSS